MSDTTWNESIAYRKQFKLPKRGRAGGQPFTDSAPPKLLRSMTHREREIIDVAFLRSIVDGKIPDELVVTFSSSLHREPWHVGNYIRTRVSVPSVFHFVYSLFSVPSLHQYVFPSFPFCFFHCLVSLHEDSKHEHQDLLQRESLECKNHVQLHGHGFIKCDNPKRCERQQHPDLDWEYDGSSRNWCH